MLRRPTPQGTVYRKGRSVHSVRTSQYAGEESAAEQPSSMIVLQMQRAPINKGIEGEPNDDNTEDQFDHVFVTLGQERNSQWNAGQCGEDQTACAAQVHVPPVLKDDHAGHLYGDENSQRCRDVER